MEIAETLAWREIGVGMKIVAQDLWYIAAQGGGVKN